MQVRLVNRMPTFREYVEGVFRKQMDELDKDIKTLQHNKRVIKSMLREFKGFTDEQLKGMFKEDDKAIVEYNKMRAQVDEYVSAINASAPETTEKQDEHIQEGR